MKTPIEQVREALEEVMSWIANWDPSFVNDPEWPATKAKADTALTSLKSLEGPRLTVDEVMEVVKRHMADNALMFIHSHSYEHPMTSDQNNAFREALTKAAKP